MKKIFYILSLLILFIFCLASCEEEGDLGNKTHTHDWGEWETTTEADCLNDGEKQRECASCDEIQTETVKAPGYHTYGDWLTVKEADCLNDGKKERVCSCGAKETDTIESRGYHLFGEWELVDEATCEEEGEEERTCECGYSETREIYSEHDAPHGICLECSKVTDSDEAADYYYSVNTNAFNYYFSCYMYGDVHAKYEFTNYDLEIYCDNAYDGKIAVTVSVSFTTSLIAIGDYFKGSGFIAYEVRQDGNTIKDGTAIISGYGGGTANIQFTAFFYTPEEAEFSILFDDYYI